MIIRKKLLILTTAFLGITTITACNKPQEASSQFEPVASAEINIQDDEVTANVKKALLLDDKVKGFDIMVVTTKGDVRLTGVVDNHNQIDYIDKLVRNVKGVHSIHDELVAKVK